MRKSIFQKLLTLIILAMFSVTLYSCGGRSDEDIRKDITEKMSTSPEMSAVSVDVKDGVVTTSGQVKDESTRSMSESTIKGIKGVKSVVNNVTVAAAPEATPPPVEVAPDDALTTGAADAVKDFPGVKAEVMNGEITLTGEITRAKLQTLMQSLSSLNPKKINNQLTIK